ncbi:MAG: hypothetical protein ACR2FN_07505 [Chitinophagaceae bacterium]
MKKIILGGSLLLSLAFVVNANSNHSQYNLIAHNSVDTMPPSSQSSATGGAIYTGKRDYLPRQYQDNAQSKPASATPDNMNNMNSNSGNMKDTTPNNMNNQNNNMNDSTMNNMNNQNKNMNDSTMNNQNNSTDTTKAPPQKY